MKTTTLILLAFFSFSAMAQKVDQPKQETVNLNIETKQHNKKAGIIFAGTCLVAGSVFQLINHNQSIPNEANYKTKKEFDIAQNVYSEAQRKYFNMASFCFIASGITFITVGIKF